MYAWKCWRDTRVSFYIFLSIDVALAALLWRMYFTMSKLPPNEFLTFAWLILVFASSTLLPLAGISFGATGIGEEFAHKTASFLLTKPRSIRYFVWTAWKANAVQFLALTGGMLFVGASILPWRSHAPFIGRLLLAFLPGIVLTFLLFGVTYLLGVLHKNGRNGFLSTLGLVVLFPTICYVVKLYWHIHLPSPADMYPVGIVGELVAHPELASTLPHFWPLAGWLLVALVCPFIAQLVLERTEL
jgi:ABC-type transport system involved in multi-copper enzyme maturation permease subunit